MADNDMPSQDKRWHLDKRVPLALIFALFMQTIAAAWWASNTDSRLSVVEKRLDAAAPQGDRLTRVEVKLETVQAGIDEIKRILRKQ
jgi:hypothetical protein